MTKLLTIFNANAGYSFIYNKETKEYMYLHRYIWELHNGKIPEGYHIHHIDGNRANNDISNLEAIPASEHNSREMKRIRATSKRDLRKTRQSNKRSCPVICLGINKMFPSIAEAARFANTNPGNIINQLKGRQKTANGYTFFYLDDTTDEQAVS